ncbi:MAG: ATP-binding protein [Halopseudomonas aestusnigri]
MPDRSVRSPLRVFIGTLLLTIIGLSWVIWSIYSTEFPNTDIQNDLLIKISVIAIIICSGWVVVLRLLRRWRNEIFAAQKQTELANEAKTNFLATMSHEIRTPLNGILGVAQLMSDTDLDEDQLFKLETIQTSGKTLLAIINDVLDMSKIEAGAIELEDTAFSLSNILSTSITAIYSLASEKGLDFHLNEPGNTPKYLVGDPVRLRQILWNLMSNAIKFTSTGGVTVTIAAEDVEDNRITAFRDIVMRIRIEDTGKGIDPDRLDSIFDPFIQEDNTITRNYGGTGLGLSIVRKMVVLMGGYIEVKSELGKGSCFDVYIPFDIATLEQQEDLSVRRKKIEISVGCGLNILVAEDNDVNAMIARAFLEKSGHSVRIAVDGLRAIEEVISSLPDLIFMDIHMPEMNGIEATKAIRLMENCADIPIIGLTAEAFEDRHDQFISEGMNGVLTKPFSEDQMHTSVVKYGVSAIVAAEKRKLTNEVKMETSGFETYSKEPLSSIGEALSLDVGEDGVQSGLGVSQNCGEQQNGFTSITSAELLKFKKEAEEVPLGNDDKIDRLIMALGIESFASVLEPAPDNLNSLIVSLAKGVEDKNIQMIKEASHAIRGVTASLCAQRVSSVAGIMEQNCRDIEAVKLLMPLLQESSEDTIRWWVSKVGHKNVIKEAPKSKAQMN